MPDRPSIVLHTENPDLVLSVLADAHPDLQVTPCDDHAGLAAAIVRAGAEIVYSVRFGPKAKFPREALVENPAVKWVAVGGSGVDHLGSWNPVTVTVTNTAGAAADMMAEYVLGAMLSFSLGLRGFFNQQRARKWIARKVEPIEGATLLILGLGHTGRAVARRAKAMGMVTLGVRARPRPTAHADEVHGTEALPGLWGRADFIVCSLPLLAETRGMVGADAFAAMKPGAVLVDVSRGGVVDESALIAALESDRLKGAALDVFATEPLPSEHPLWRYDNVIITPHCSSVFDGWDVRSARMFADNLTRYRRGEPLANVVSPELGY